MSHFDAASALLCLATSCLSAVPRVHSSELQPPMAYSSVPESVRYGSTFTCPPLWIEFPCSDADMTGFELPSAGRLRRNANYVR